MRRMPFSRSGSVALLISACLPLAAQSNSSSLQTPSAPAGPTIAPLSPVRETMTHDPWSWGVFFNGGLGVGSDRNGYRFLSAGARAGKVLTDPIGPGFLKGQFEYAAEFMPWWQGYAPPFNRYFVTATSVPNRLNLAGPFPTGGAYNGISVTPVVLRWDLTGGRRLMPFIQGAGGLIWTDHKFPPVGPVNTVGHQGTSVWNFTPQFGVGFQYFLKPRRSITFNANAVHISNASLGDSNPGVNASVQFQIGYSWWK